MSAALEVALVAALRQFVRAVKYTSGVSLEFATREAEVAIARYEAEIGEENVRRKQ